MYGPDVRKPGTFAANCLLARRLAERGVRFVQLYPPRLGSARQPAGAICRRSASDTDQPSAALVTDLKQRGLLDDTLVIWGGEFGRTVYCAGRADATTTTAAIIIRAASRIWMAGGGIKPGIVLRRDRRLLLQHRREPGPRPRSERDDPALPRHRPRAADLSSSRAAISA